ISARVEFPGELAREYPVGLNPTAQLGQDQVNGVDPILACEVGEEAGAGDPRVHLVREPVGVSRHGCRLAVVSMLKNPRVDPPSAAASARAEGRRESRSPGSSLGLASLPTPDRRAVSATGRSTPDWTAYPCRGPRGDRPRSGAGLLGRSPGPSSNRARSGSL